LTDIIPNLTQPSKVIKANNGNLAEFNTAGGSEFQVRGAAVLNDRLANVLDQ